MLNVVYTIIPIFIVILLGWLLRWRDILPSHLISPLNRIVYYLAIPALIFRAVASSSFEANFSPLLLAGTLIPLVVVLIMGAGVGRLYSVTRHDFGTFTQTCFHGNLGYIGLAVAFYFLGKDGLTRASILAGFLMLLQNFLGVLSLQVCSRRPGTDFRFFFV
ncbi:MAG: AEC family transporter, partial [Deltaproteobacteria bacterium]|nr:AEC family transporter [Deltaproteobacteria bacterium]